MGSKDDAKIDSIRLARIHSPGLLFVPSVMSAEARTATTPDRPTASGNWAQSQIDFGLPASLVCCARAARRSLVGKLMIDRTPSFGREDRLERQRGAGWSPGCPPSLDGRSADRQKDFLHVWLVGRVGGLLM